MSTAAETGGGSWPNLPMRKAQASAKLDRQGAAGDASTVIRVPVGDLSAEDALAALEAAHHRVTVVPTIEELTEDSRTEGVRHVRNGRAAWPWRAHGVGSTDSMVEAAPHHPRGAGSGCGSRHEGGAHRSLRVQRLRSGPPGRRGCIGVTSAQSYSRIPQTSEV